LSRFEFASTAKADSAGQKWAAPWQSRYWCCRPLPESTRIASQWEAYSPLGGMGKLVCPCTQTRSTHKPRLADATPRGHSV